MIQLNEEMVKEFKNALEKNYWYQMFIDGIPIWGTVGDMNNDEYHIYTHKKFEIGYNGQQIEDMNLTSDRPEELKPGAGLMFSYEVEWKPSSVEFKNRLDRFESNFIQYRVS